MSRALPTPPLSSLPLSALQAMANDMESTLDRSPKDWFERARYEVDKAVLAERKGNEEEMFVTYTRVCQCYVHCKGHPGLPEQKRKDPAWSVRFKDFKETYESFLGKARVMKQALQERPVEKENGHDANGTSSSSTPPGPNGPETSSMGSIADRMKALSGKGMDVGPIAQRQSKDLSQAPAVPHKSSALGAMSVAGGAGTFGPARLVGQEQRPRAGSATSEHRPSVRSKPQLLARQPSPPPEQPTSPPHEKAASVRQTATGSSSRSIKSNEGREGSTSTPGPAMARSPSSSSRMTSPQSITPQLKPSDSASAPNPEQAQSEFSRPLPLSPPHRSVPEDDKPSAGPPRTPDRLDDFEKAFPSLSEFGKQFEVDGPPNGAYPFEREDRPSTPPGLPKGRIGSICEEDHPEFSLPDVPTFPDLPSAPTNRPGPGLPPPPGRPDGLKAPESTGIRPPSPDMVNSLKRPASTANVSTLPSTTDFLTDSPPSEFPPEPPAPSAVLRPIESSKSRSPVPESRDRPPWISFPVAKPTHGPLPPREPPREVSKPKFPLSNSVDPDTLRTYFHNPSVDILLLDARNEEEYQRGYVGQEYEGRGAKMNVVWIDPTILMRNEMTSAKLEDSLSLLPDRQRKAFEDRHKADLVVVYDSHSVSFPRRGSQPTPLSRLWDFIYEHEFNKRLERTPVMLAGGYAAWLEFIKKRVARNANANGSGRPYNPKAVNGYSSSVPLPDRPPSSGSLSGDLASKRANRDLPVYQAANYAKNITDSFGYGPQSMTGETSYTGHHASSRHHHLASSRPSRSSRSPSKSLSSYSSQTTIAPPPQASIHPGPGARRRSDYVEQHNQTYSGYHLTPSPTSRASIDYPQAHALISVPQPPPAAQSHALERYETRPAVVRSGSIRGLDLVAREGDEVRYWNDIVLGLTGLKNLGNTCYMNSTLQCLSATFPFTSYFLDGSYKKSINLYNPLGMKGNLANAFSELLKALWKEDYTFLSPVTFRKNIISFNPQFSGSDQHDSQEFLAFVLDGLHEDLNRVKHKPAPIDMTPEREAALETLPPEVASEKEWQIYKMRNDSFIVDLFQGQYRNRLECLTCHKTSTTYDTFMYMSLPVPAGKKAVVVQELIDEFVKSEVMEKEDAWNCPRCKVPRRASKTLTIARLPPVLLIQLKRFSTQNGVFWDKSETPVIFPVNGLDLTRYMPRRQPTGKEDPDDPRTQLGPFKYDLYGVSNHMGTLSSGHYTAYVKSSKGWMYCEDSKVTKAQEKDVVSRPAYILFYKRIRV